MPSRSGRSDHQGYRGRLWEILGRVRPLCHESSSLKWRYWHFDFYSGDKTRITYHINNSSYPVKVELPLINQTLYKNISPSYKLEPRYQKHAHYCHCTQYYYSNLRIAISNQMVRKNLQSGSKTWVWSKMWDCLKRPYLGIPYGMEPFSWVVLAGSKFC